MGYRVHINLKLNINTKKVDVPGTGWYKNMWLNTEVFNTLPRKQLKRDLAHESNGLDFDTPDTFRYEYKPLIELMEKEFKKKGDVWVGAYEYFMECINRTITEEFGGKEPKYIIIAEW